MDKYRIDSYQLSKKIQSYNESRQAKLEAEEMIKNKRYREEKQSANESYVKYAKERSMEESYNKAYSENKRNFKKGLLVECLYNIYKEAVDSLPPTFISPLVESGINLELAQRSIVTDFVNEEGMDNLLFRFKRKNVLLAEWAKLIEETTKKCCSKDTKNGKGEYLIPGEIKDDFFASLATSTPDDISSSIKSKVIASIDSFLDSNQKTRDAVNDIVNKANNKIDAEADSNIGESVSFKTRAKWKQTIKNQKRTLLGEMVTRLAKTTLKDSKTYSDYINEDGGINMDNIVGTSIVMYTFLEMVNSLDLRPVDEAYINKKISEI